MEKMNVSAMVMVVATLMLGCVMIQSASALIHVVGGSDGWTIPPNATFYADWAKPRTFGIGDKLVFPYRPGAHNVIQVLKGDYETCGHENVVDQFAKGPTIIQFNETGDYYFYSGVGTHCEMGQKLHIAVGNQPGSSGKDVSFSSLFGDGPAGAPSNSLGPDSAHSSASPVHVFGLVLVVLPILNWVLL